MASGAPVRDGSETRKTTVRATLVGGGLFVVAALMPWMHFTDRVNLGDIRHYRALAEKMLDGSVPYHELFVEYPPGALPIFLLPTVAGHSVGTYGMAFRIAAAVVTLVLIAVVAATLHRLGASFGRVLAAAAFVGTCPALLGPVFFERFDVWAATLTGFALLALLYDRAGTSAALLALGAATKVYPALLLPLLLARVMRQKGANAALRCAAIAAGVFAVIVAPFAVVGPGGVAYSFKIQGTRLLEIESPAAAVLLCLHRLGLYDPTIHAGLSFELVGRLPDALGALQTFVLVAGVAVVWWAFSTSDQSDDDLVLAAAAVVAVTVAFDKVLSPQYLVWLVPLVALLWKRVGATGWFLVCAASLLTLAFFPGRFRDLRHEGSSAWIVLGRDVVLVALAAVLVLAVLRRARHCRRRHSPVVAAESGSIVP